MQKIIFLKGLPASGKSTWAKQYCIDNPDTIRLNKDDIRAEFGNPSWSQTFEELVLTTQRNRGLQALSTGNSIIIDDTNFAEKHHNYWYSMAKKHSCEFEEQFFEVPVEECIRRDLLRENPVGEYVIRGMYKQNIKTIDVHFDKRFILNQDESLPKCIICDLDGTLALHNGRNPFDHSKIYTDKINPYVRRIIQQYAYLGVEIIYLSGRMEDAKVASENWLKVNGCWFFYGQQVIMRKDKDFRSDSIVKTELYETFIKDKYFVEFVLDDRDKVVKTWRELGLLCLQVYYGDF